MNRLYFGDGLDGRMDSLGSLDGYVRNHLTSRIDKMEEERLTARVDATNDGVAKAVNLLQDHIRDHSHTPE